jgi:hypothetical protein
MLRIAVRIVLWRCLHLLRGHGGMCKYIEA